MEKSIVNKFITKYNISPYDIFGNVKTKEKLDTIYRKKVLIVHPDRGGKEEDFKLLKDAYNCIKYVISYSSIKTLQEKKKEYKPEKELFKDLNLEKKEEKEVKKEIEKKIEDKKYTPEEIEKISKEKRKVIIPENINIGFEDINKFFDYYNEKNRSLVKHKIRPSDDFSNSYCNIISYNGLIVEEEEEEEIDMDVLKVNTEIIRKDLENIKSFKPKEIKQKDKRNYGTIDVKKIDEDMDSFFENNLTATLKKNLIKNKEKLYQSKKTDLDTLEKAKNNTLYVNNNSGKNVENKKKSRTNKP